jgi:hypothetical protein
MPVYRYWCIINQIVKTLTTEIELWDSDTLEFTDGLEGKVYELIDAMSKQEFYDFIDCIPKTPDGLWHDAPTPKELNREVAYWAIMGELRMMREPHRLLRRVRFRS